MLIQIVCLKKKCYSSSFFKKHTVFLHKFLAPSSIQASNETDDGKGNCNDVLSLEAQRAVGSAVAKLGLALLEKLQTGSEQPNIIISPLSVSLALAELALGKHTQTQEIIANHAKGAYIYMLCCLYIHVYVYIHFKSLGARNKTEEKLLEILQAKELPNFHETLSCLQEQLTAKAVKMASRLYLMPGE